MLHIAVVYEEFVLFLFKSSHTKHIYLLFGEITPIASAEIFLCKTSKLNTIELYNTVAKTFKDATNNAILATMYFYSYLTLIAIVSIFNSISLYFSIFELNTIRYLLKCLWSYWLI